MITFCKRPEVEWRYRPFAVGLPESRRPSRVYHASEASPPAPLLTEAGTYSCEATVSSGVTGSAFTLGLVEDGKVTSLCRINVPQTGNNNWDTYQVVKANISKTLEEGEQIFRITINGANCNIDKIELKLLQSSAIDDVTFTPRNDNGYIYNLAGQRVDENYKGIVIKNGKKVLNK